jgi:integrase
MACWDRSKRRMIRRSAKAENLEQAKQAARNWKAELERNEHQAMQTRGEKLTTKRAIAEAIRLGGRPNKQKSDEHLKDQKRFAGYFELWLGARARYWDDIDVGLVNEYIDSLTQLKPKSRRNYIAPIVTAAAYWHSRDNRLYRPMRISHPDLDLGRREKRFLLLAQLRRCIELAQESNARFGLIGFVVCGMAGLRLRELACITREDFDADAGTLQIRRAKNDASPRTIPLLDGVAAFVASCFETDPSPYLVTDVQTKEQGNNLTVSRQMRRVLDGAGFSHIAPKDAGRKCFMNWTAVPGVDSCAFDAYVGHAPRRTADRFYRTYTVEQLHALVLDPLELHLRDNTPATPAATEPGDTPAAKVIDVERRIA